MQSTTKRPRADLPTVILHWGLVAALLVSVSTGWRIAGMTESYTVWHWIDVLILQGNVIRWHFVSATLLTMLVVGYLVFVWRMGLSGRLKFRWAALRSPDHATRWGALNKLIYWVAFALLLGAAATGTLMYFAPTLLPAELLVSVHEILSWVFVAYIALHVVAQILLGGIKQLLKMFSPRLAYGVGVGLTVSAGLATAAVVYVADGQTLNTLVLAKVAVAPLLDGDASDAIWQKSPEVVVPTSRGFNLTGGSGAVDVHVRALHDGQKAYFLFRWKDPTRSQKHIPLIKTAEGWKLLHTNYYNNDENEFYEDKFAVMLAHSPVAGGNTINVGPKPIDGKPGPSNGLGLHATRDGSLADVWHWKSVRTGALRQMDDNYFGAPIEPKAGARYTGGYTQDPKTDGGYEQNFEKLGDGKFVKLKGLPRDLAAQQARMGKFSADVNVSDEGIFSMHKSDVVPYTAALDAQIPVGTVIPSVVFDKPFAGDRGEVSADAIWKDGWWTLEASRKLDTGSKFDQAIVNDLYLWVSVFDHNQVRHTRHMRPLKLRLE